MEYFPSQWYFGKKKIDLKKVFKKDSLSKLKFKSEVNGNMICVNGQIYEPADCEELLLNTDKLEREHTSNHSTKFTPTVNEITDFRTTGVYQKGTDNNAIKNDTNTSDNTNSHQANSEDLNEHQLDCSISNFSEDFLGSNA